jgi:hypothetical protein
MVNQVDIYENSSLEELDIHKGQLLAFENANEDIPFLILKPNYLVNSFQYPEKEIINLEFSSKNKASGRWRPREVWTAGYQGNILALWTPKGSKARGSLVPRFELISGICDSSYIINSAYSGKEAIQQALKENKQGLDFYLELLDSDNLIDRLLSESSL